MEFVLSTHPLHPLSRSKSTLHPHPLFSTTSSSPFGYPSSFCTRSIRTPIRTLSHSILPRQPQPRQNHNQPFHEQYHSQGNHSPDHTPHSSRNAVTAGSACRHARWCGSALARAHAGGVSTSTAPLALRADGEFVYSAYKVGPAHFCTRGAE